MNDIETILQRLNRVERELERLARVDAPATLSSLKIGDVAGGNYIQLDEDGLRLIGAATVFDDLRVEPTVRGSGPKAPSYSAWKGGIYMYYFDNAAVASEKEINFKLQSSHGWKEGSTIYLHVHWLPVTAGSAGDKVRWGLEYVKAKPGGVFGTPTTVYADTIGVGSITNADTHSITPFAGISMSGDSLSTAVLCRLFRNSSDLADTYAGTAGLIFIDAHIEIDALGSKEEYMK